MDNQKNAKRRIPQIDILLAIATVSLGIEFLPNYFGLDLKGFSLSWFLLPPILLVSLTLHINKYLSLDILKWGAVFLLSMIGYAFFIDWNENIPFSHVPQTLSSFFLSLIVLMFYIVHGRTSEGRFTFMLMLVLTGFIATLLNIFSIFGLTEKGIESIHLGQQIYINRISPLGDPNIVTIYLIAFAVSLPLWQMLIGRTAGFIIGSLCYLLTTFTVITGTASRGGFITIIASGLVLFFLYWVQLQKMKRYKLSTLFLLGFICLILFISFEKFNIPKQFETLSLRFSVIAEKGLMEDALRPRIVSAQWLIKDILTSPNILGIGYEQFASQVEPEGGIWLPHNSFVDLYVIGGIIGFIAYIILWSRSIISNLRCLRRDDRIMKIYGTWGLAFGIAIGILLMSVSIAWTKIIWAYLGVGISLYNATRSNSMIS